MEPSDKEAFWSKHFEDWQSSGLFQIAYCKQHDLKISNFTYWRTRQIKRQRKFLPMAVEPPGSSDRVVIDLPYGIRLEVGSQSLSTLLPGILKTVQDAARC